MDTYHFSLPVGLPEVHVEDTAKPAGRVSEQLTTNARGLPSHVVSQTTSVVPSLVIM